MILPSQLPEVENRDSQICPDCDRSTTLASVYRDTGRWLYCRRCMKSKWKNLKNPHWAAVGLVTGDVRHPNAPPSWWERIKAALRWEFLGR